MKLIVSVCWLIAATSAASKSLNLYLPRLPTLPVQAGAPNVDGTPVTSGIIARRGLLPYQAALFPNGGGWLCGATLIKPRWLLTAAHCAAGVNTFTVYLGAQQLDLDEEGRLVIETKHKIVHELWNETTVTNDIALVNLGQDVRMSDFIQPIEIANEADFYGGLTARVSGWGRPLEGSNALSAHLSFVDLTIIANSECASYYGSPIINSTICTSGFGGLGPCYGDGGGPLVEQLSGRLVGVVSFVSSRGCADGSPAGYARVAHFAPWIAATTAKRRW